MYGREKTVRTCLFTMLVGLLSGCGGAAAREWEIAVENRSDTAVDFAATFGLKTPTSDNSGNASVANVAKGKTISLVVGPGTTTVRTVTVTRQGDVQELTPDVDIGPGKRYFVVVDAKGKASGSVSNR